MAVAPDGSIYVTDAGAHRLLRYAPDGLLADSWPIPWANSLEGGHLAVAAAGRILMTEPEQGCVVMLDQAGNALRSWRVPDGEEFAAKPVGVAVDVQGGVRVADSSLGRLVRLESCAFDHATGTGQVWRRFWEARETETRNDLKFTAPNA